MQRLGIKSHVRDDGEREERAPREMAMAMAMARRKGFG